MELLAAEEARVARQLRQVRRPEAARERGGHARALGDVARDRNAAAERALHVDAEADRARLVLLDAARRAARRADVALLVVRPEREARLQRVAEGAGAIVVGEHVAPPVLEREV